MAPDAPIPSVPSYITGLRSPCYDIPSNQGLHFVLFTFRCYQPQKRPPVFSSRLYFGSICLKEHSRSFLSRPPFSLHHSFCSQDGKAGYVAGLGPSSACEWHASPPQTFRETWISGHVTAGAHFNVHLSSIFFPVGIPNCGTVTHWSKYRPESHARVNRTNQPAYRVFKPHCPPLDSVRIPCCRAQFQRQAHLLRLSSRVSNRDPPAGSRLKVTFSCPWLRLRHPSRSQVGAIMWSRS